MVFYSLKINGYKFDLYWHERLSFKFIIWVNSELVGRTIEGKIYLPWYTLRKITNDFPHLWDDYNRTGDPDDIPF